MKAIMRKGVIFFLVLAFVFLGVGLTTAATIDFELLGDITGGTVNYQGFNFLNVDDYTKPDEDDGTYKYDGTIGSKSIASNNFADIFISSSDENEFSLDSFTFTIDNYYPWVYIDGYKDGSLTSQLIIKDATHSSPYFVDFSGLHTTAFWGDIDKLHIHGGGFHVCLDDITYNSGTAPVPEPTTFLLFGVGLLGLAPLKKKFFPQGS